MSDEWRVLPAPTEPDPGENLDRMYAHIILGVSKEASRTVCDAATSALWDSMSAGVAAIKARGHMPVYSNDPDPFDPEAEY